MNGLLRDYTREEYKLMARLGISEDNLLPIDSDDDSFSDREITEYDMIKLLSSIIRRAYGTIEEVGTREQAMSFTKTMYRYINDEVSNIVNYYPRQDK